MPTEELIDQSFESIPTQEEAPKKERFLTLGKFKPKLKIVFILGGGLFVLLILLTILANLTQKSIKLPKPLPLPAPSPTPAEEKIASPSAYATDSAILKIEEEIEAIEEKLQSTDLKEAALNPPILDMKVEFEE